MAKTKSDKLTARHIFGYGCGDCGGSITFWLVSGYMTRYLQVHLQINEVILATLLLIWNIWDAVNDPLMGTIMDMCFTKAKPGADKFRPWIAASIPIIVIGLIALFVVPPMLGGGVAMIAAVFVLKIVYEAGYTMMNIGMGSLLGNMAKNDAERATLSSARGFGSVVAMLVGGGLIPICIKFFGDNAAGFGKTSVVIAIIGAVVIFLHYILTEERNKTATVVEKTPEEKEAEKFKLSDIINIITKNRAFLALVLHSICICAVQALGTGAATYMYADVMGDIGLQSISNILSAVMMIVILIIAPILTKKWDLVAIIRFCLVCGFGIMAVNLAYVMLVSDFSSMVFIVLNALGNGMIQMSVAMQWGLVAESIDYNEYLTGKRNEGTIYGFFSLSRRVGSTIANSLSVILIAAIGYDATLTAQGLLQAESTMAGIKAMVVGFPAVAALGSFFCFTFIWNINKDVRAKMAQWKTAKAK